MFRGGTYSAILHISALAVIVLGLPSLTFLLPKLREPPEIRVVMMSEQDARDLSKAAEEARREPGQAGAPSRTETTSLEDEKPLPAFSKPEDDARHSPLSGRSVVKEWAAAAEADDERTVTRRPGENTKESVPTVGTGDDAMLTSPKTETTGYEAPMPRAGSAGQFRPDMPPMITPVSFTMPAPNTSLGNDAGSNVRSASGAVAIESPPALDRSAATEAAASGHQSVKHLVPSATDGEIVVAQQQWTTTGGASRSDAISALMARFAEQVPRLKSLREALHDSQPARSNPAIEQSVKRMEERSEEGYAHAQFSLAEMQLTGEGVPKDPKKAVELLTRAGMSGYLPAQLTLGMLAAEGTAMKRNLAEAHTWLAVAAEQGHKAAKEVLPKLEKHMSTRDTVEARKRSYQLHQVLVIIHGGDLSKASKTELSERLRVAAALGDVESVYVLLAQGADADSADSDGRTPLIEAAWRGYPKIVKSLIDNGANLSSADNTKKNAVMWAAINGHADVIANLLAAGSPLDNRDNEGITALMRAAWNGHMAAVKVLLNAGAKVDATDKKGLTAVDYAGKAGNAPIQQLLRSVSRG